MQEQHHLLQPGTGVREECAREGLLLGPVAWRMAYALLGAAGIYPLESLTRDKFRSSDHRSLCPWKGEASYFDVVVDGDSNPAAAWYYPTPKPAAAEIAGRVAFWRGVRVEGDVEWEGCGSPGVTGLRA